MTVSVLDSISIGAEADEGGKIAFIVAEAWLIVDSSVSKTKLEVNDSCVAEESNITVTLSELVCPKIPKSIREIIRIADLINIYQVFK